MELYDPIRNEWRKETKEEVMRKEDIEGNKPCDLCWEAARDSGVYSWPLKTLKNAKRCKCGRMLGTGDMPMGPGKYDDLCTNARNDAKAEGVILLVFNGKAGNGFSCQATLELTAAIPALLRQMADQIEADVGNRDLLQQMTREHDAT